jgi:predicted aconitase
MDQSSPCAFFISAERRKTMRKQTDLAKVKQIARSLLFTDIHETEFSPVIVSHPFTDSGFVASPNADGEIGLLTDEGRKATWVARVQTTKKPEAQLLGSAIGMRVMEDVPYVVGLDKWLGNELNDSACAYLKDFGAATASNGAVGLYHIANLTPEAKELGESLIADGAREYIIDDAELERVKNNYPVIWKKPDAKPKLCFVGCPHLSLEQLKGWTDKIETGLKKNGKNKVSINTVFTAAPAVLENFEKPNMRQDLKQQVLLPLIFARLCI